MHRRRSDLARGDQSDSFEYSAKDGTTTVVKAGPVFEILGVNKLDSLTLASPVVLDNQIFIRTADHLYCIQKKEAGAHA
jgi:outer membrane protein assembly factor BamB